MVKNGTYKQCAICGNEFYVIPDPTIKIKKVK